MKFRKVEDGYLVRLEKGEEIVGSLTDFVREKQIPAGFITGMGAVSNATIGIFDTEKREYIKKTYKGDLEIGNLTANISYFEDSDEPFVHCHVTMSDSSLNAFTGHLFEARVSVTLEVYVRTLKKKLVRKEDPGMGFKFWQL
jgi:predicted DNA-binding protein with PD1-like motif